MFTVCKLYSYIALTAFLFTARRVPGRDAITIS